jgi:hypothetical protein
MALADVDVVPFWYVVEETSLTVTFCPADVVMVKPDVDTLPTVPAAPPAAGPDRALDPPARDPNPPAEVLAGAAGAGGGVVAEEDLVRPMEAPTTAQISAAVATAAIHRLRVLDSHRRNLGVPADGSDAGLDTGRPGRVSSGLVGS